MHLFDDVVRTEGGPKKTGEGDFGFLNRVDGPFWDEVRELLEGWFTRYPDDDKAGLRDAYRSSLVGRHLGAWWELYLHELLLRLGYEIEVHPELEGTKRHPDFRLQKDGDTLLLEAAVVFSGISTKGGPTGEPPDWMTAA